LVDPPRTCSYGRDGPASSQYQAGMDRLLCLDERPSSLGNTCDNYKNSHQMINQSINQSINRPIDRSIYPSLRYATRTDREVCRRRRKNGTDGRHWRERL